jgi:hypothetical protein
MKVNSRKKSIKSANPKVSPINFYPDETEEKDEEIKEPESIILSAKIKNAWK